MRPSRFTDFLHIPAIALRTHYQRLLINNYQRNVCSILPLSIIDGNRKNCYTCNLFPPKYNAYLQLTHILLQLLNTTYSKSISISDEKNGPLRLHTVYPCRSLPHMISISDEKNGPLRPEYFHARSTSQRNFNLRREEWSLATMR